MGTIDPGEGWRLLAADEVIRSGDEYYWNGNWYKAKRSVDCFVTDVRYDAWRRRIAKENSGVEVTTSGPYVAIEVHRAALAEIERLRAELDKRCEIWRIARDIAANERDAAESEVKRLKAELEAVKQPQPEPEPEWFDLTPFGEHRMRVRTDYAFHTESGEWRHTSAVFSVSTVDELKQLGFSQFRCLLKDAPPELVAKAKQTESPDDWVTQDRVPARPGIDERQWVQYDGTALGWVPVKKIGWSGMKHGDVIHGDRLELRCRRKDLPPLPEQPKTETVVFYEVIVKQGFPTEYLSLEWVSEVPRHSNYTATGRAVEREVVR